MDTDRTDVLPGEMPVGVAIALHLTPGLLLTGFFVLSQPL
jgi:hypothetical protein